MLRPIFKSRDESFDKDRGYEIFRNCKKGKPRKVVVFASKLDGSYLGKIIYSSTDTANYCRVMFTTRDGFTYSGGKSNGYNYHLNSEAFFLAVKGLGFSIDNYYAGQGDSVSDDVARIVIKHLFGIGEKDINIIDIEL